MMYVVVGRNTRKGAEELKWVDISGEELASLASTADMFGGDRTFLLVGALNDEARGQEFLDMAPVFVESPHTFIFEEEKLLKHERDAVTKAGAKVEEVKVVKKEYTFDTFGVAKALEGRDKKQLWLALTAAFRAGEKPEAIAGLMVWKARDMLGSGRGAYKYKKDELAALSRSLVWMYHDAHRGLGDLELLLERFALKL